MMVFDDWIRESWWSFVRVWAGRMCGCCLRLVLVLSRMGSVRGNGKEGALAREKHVFAPGQLDWGREM